MRAAIYGAGAMGTVLGAFVSAKGIEIDLISRNKEHIEKLKKDGARIIGGAQFMAPVSALTPDEMQGEYDIILLMTKQRENPEILSFLKKFLKEDGALCTLQNGIPEPAVAEAVGAERCFGCAVAWSARLKENGVAELTSNPENMSFSLGAYENRNPLIFEIKKLLECAGKVTVEENLLGARWTKLAINSAFSSLSALTGLTYGEIAKDKTCAAAALEIMREAFAVSDKAGIKCERLQGHDIKAVFGYKNSLGRWRAKLLLPLLVKKHRDGVSGMYYDLAAGRKCDIDYICGAVSRLGKKFGRQTPLCDKAIKLIREIESGKRSIDKNNIEAFL